MRRIYLVGAVVLSIILVASGLWFLWSRNIILPDHRVEVAYIGTGIRVTWIADRPGTILWVKGAANPRCAPPGGDGFDFPAAHMLPHRVVVCTRIGSSTRYETHGTRP